ncbi:hypothetical protein H5410_043331 [Solanum commersonii]|uniref:Uncharacterized protein n=1 Tax=Solanum commersonii TaxID=4109 RepID=A0A9J5XX92_SOLCO|nr:hypothetical protein H5410_043331 [Solanum commersonii]
MMSCSVMMLRLRYTSVDIITHEYSNQNPWGHTWTMYHRRTGSHLRSKSSKASPSHISLA